MNPEQDVHRHDQGSDDPILAEVRRNRAALVEATGGTLESLCAHLATRERSGHAESRDARSGDVRPGDVRPGDADHARPAPPSPLDDDRTSDA